MNLSNINISYIIIPSCDEATLSILDSRSYQILPIQSYLGGQYSDSYMGYSDVDNNSLRTDILFLLEKTNCKNLIIKYKGESIPRRISEDGSEKLLEINQYSDNHDKDMTFLYRGMSFSFTETKRYWKPKKKEDFRVGMIVEYFNNNQWTEKLVEDPNNEWDKLYKLLLKYDKVRVQSRQ